ncbi:hypothetical protein KPH14_002640 [Odynerus spinipes]|uniref:Uncharacterized protein n=1 Tax=Odynerus spinipes TaxID=1348599 RepID=A0AAD9RHL5_9HYME|nr:hypothetical protein KPH14_002640 [Odynerus spinipes]
MALDSLVLQGSIHRSDRHGAHHLDSVRQDIGVHQIDGGNHRDDVHRLVHVHERRLEIVHDLERTLRLDRAGSSSASRSKRLSIERDHQRIDEVATCHGTSSGGNTGMLEVPPLTEPPSTVAECIPEHEAVLQDDILNIIGARLEAEHKTGAAIHKDVSLRWSEILKRGLPSDEVRKLREKYPVPVNCTFISVPKLNTEITAAVQETAVKG